jgi:hypothetical protein
MYDKMFFVTKPVQVDLDENLIIDLIKKGKAIPLTESGGP